MHRINRILAALVVAIPVAPLAAGETTLEFKLITRTVEQTAFPAPVEGVTVVAVRAAGVGIFADGSISNKEFAFTMHNKGATGEYDGYSGYWFEDGSSLQMSFTGGWSGGPDGGKYTIVSGTGKFEGATGTGEFNGTGSPFKGANMYNVRLEVTTPD